MLLLLYVIDTLSSNLILLSALTQSVLLNALYIYIYIYIYINKADLTFSGAKYCVLKTNEALERHTIMRLSH